MPDCEETQTIRASVVQHAVGVQQGLRDVQLRLQVDRHDRVPAGGVHVDQQLVAGDAGVVDDDVDPAVPLAQVLDRAAAAASAAVMSSCSAVPPISLATSASLSPAAGMSTATTWAPSRAMTFAIAAPMPRAAPVTTATLPASGLSSSSPAGTSAADSGDHLAVDVGRPAGQEEPHRAGDRALGARGRRRAGSPSTRSRSSLPMERTSPSSACRAAAWAGESASDGGSARISTRPVARSRLIAGREEVVRAGQVGRGRAGRSRRGSPRPASRRPWRRRR